MAFFLASLGYSCSDIHEMCTMKILALPLHQMTRNELSTDLNNEAWELGIITCTRHPNKCQDSSTGHFRVAFSFCFKTIVVENFPKGNESRLHVHCLANPTYFHNERLYTRNRFETEVQGNSEMESHIQLLVC